MYYFYLRMFIEIPQPEWYKTRRIFSVKLETTVDDILDAPACEYCGQITEKVYTSYTCGDAILVKATPAAGYYCKADDVLTLSSEAVLETLVKARKILFEQGDTETARAFGTSIRHEQDIIAQRKKLNS